MGSNTHPYKTHLWLPKESKTRFMGAETPVLPHELSANFFVSKLLLVFQTLLFHTDRINFVGGGSCKLLVPACLRDGPSTGKGRFLGFIPCEALAAAAGAVPPERIHPALRTARKYRGRNSPEPLELK